MMDKIKYSIEVDNKGIKKALSDVERCVVRLQKAIDNVNKLELKINIVSVESTKKWWQIWK